VSGHRLERALTAFLRQEFGASAAAIIGFIDILLDDARGQNFADAISDLERMRQATVELSALIEHTVTIGVAGGALPRASLRHELRTPLNASRAMVNCLSRRRATVGERRC
jgi:adenylate cyclase